MANENLTFYCSLQLTFGTRIRIRIENEARIRAIDIWLPAKCFSPSTREATGTQFSKFRHWHRSLHLSTLPPLAESCRLTLCRLTPLSLGFHPHQNCLSACLVAGACCPPVRGCVWAWSTLWHNLNFMHFSLTPKKGDHLSGASISWQSNDTTTCSIRLKRQPSQATRPS